MARFTPEQVHSIVEINQLISDWAVEMDIANGTGMADLLTDDVNYTVRGIARIGKAEVVKFYEGRLAELGATPAGVPVHRHALCNLRVAFRSAGDAGITFSLIYFTEMVKGLGADCADPFSYADVVMDVRREGDGHWRISRFDSVPTFVRQPKG
ncbi:MAG: nuclear transport factor 2 family protein [Sphingomonadales bacterium]|nr:nuclear transport factor 2 family protein [Sphingomonadales bacterium]